MLQFRLERGDDEIKYCRKIKLMQRAHLALMRSKHDIARCRDDVGPSRGKNICN
jgi:hypothetical protein